MSGTPLFLSARPTLEVRDVPAALQYFSGAFGFSVDVTMGQPPEFAIVSHGPASFALTATTRPAIAEAVTIYFDVADVAAIDAVCRDHGLDVVQPLTCHPWGMLDLVVRGPEGHRFAFGQRLT